MRRGGSIACAAWLVVAACSKDQATPTPAAGSAQPGATLRTPPGEPSAKAPDAGANSDNKITIEIARPRAATRALGTRCVLGGDPLVSDCVGGTQGVAVTADGTLYVATGTMVRRYQRTEDAGCSYAPSGEPIELPPDVARPQKLGGGPTYMRSGGGAWSLVRSGPAIYAYDFLAGLFRIDRGTPEPVCTEVYGYSDLAALGKRLLIARGTGIAEITLGKAGACKATSAGIDDAARGKVYAVADRLWLARGSKLARYDGTTPTVVGEGTRICSVSAITACDDGACVIDNNCMQLIQLDAAGQVVRTIEDRTLFPTRPWSLGDALTLETGAVLVLGRHRDQVAGKDTCEAVVYELPAALFAR